MHAQALLTFHTSSDFWLDYSAKKSGMYTIRVSTSLDLDQTWHFAGPDLGPNCLQGLSAAGKEIKAVLKKTHNNSGLMRFINLIYFYDIYLLIQYQTV